MEAKFAGDKKGMDPLATDSLDVSYSPETEIDHAPSDFWEKRLIVTPNLRLRRENFGGIIVPQGRQPVFIDNTAYEIIDRLKTHRLPFLLRELNMILIYRKLHLISFLRSLQKGFLEKLNE